MRRSIFRSLPALAVLAAACVLATPGPLSAQETEPTVLAVQHVMPAVVDISADSLASPQPSYAQNPGAYSDARQNYAYNQVRYGQTRRLSGGQMVRSLGAGFIVSPDGLVVTNYHVVDAGQSIVATTSDGRAHRARLVNGDRRLDVAVLKIDADPRQRFAYISLDPRQISPNFVGQTVIAVGNPVGYGKSISRGIISAVNRSVEVEGMIYRGLVQTDAAINPGNSGGPVIDLNGRLVGISTVKRAYSEGGVPLQGLGFAIPGAAVTRIVSGLLGRPLPAAAAPWYPANSAPPSRRVPMQGY